MPFKSILLVCLSFCALQAILLCAKIGAFQVRSAVVLQIGAF